jgi:hypothetical protein
VNGRTVVSTTPVTRPQHTGPGIKDTPADGEAEAEGLILGLTEGEMLGETDGDIDGEIDGDIDGL